MSEQSVAEQRRRVAVELREFVEAERLGPWTDLQYRTAAVLIVDGLAHR